MKEFRVHDLSVDEPDREAVIINAHSAEEAAQAVLGFSVTRHPGARKPVIAKAYSQGAGGLTMVRLYRRVEAEPLLNL